MVAQLVRIRTLQTKLDGEPNADNRQRIKDDIAESVDHYSAVSDSLAGWLNRGGFAPDLGKLVTEALRNL